MSKLSVEGRCVTFSTYVKEDGVRHNVMFGCVSEQAAFALAQKLLEEKACIGRIETWTDNPANDPPEAAILA